MSLRSFESFQSFVLSKGLKGQRGPKGQVWIAIALFLTALTFAKAQDNRGIVADGRLERITGAAPVDATSFFEQSLFSEPLRDVTVSPNNRFAYGITSDGQMLVYEIDNEGAAPSLNQVDSVTLPLSQPVSIKISKDARRAYIGGRGEVVSVNLFTENSAGAFSEFVHYDYTGDASGRRTIDVEIHPDGDKLYALVQGPRFESQKPDFPDDFGFIGILDITDDLMLMDAADPEFIMVPIRSNVYDLTDMAISPDGNIGFVTAHGSQISIATPFGAFPRLDEGTGGVLVYDLNTFAQLDLIPTAMRGQEDTIGIRRQIFSVGQRITHPKVFQQQILTDAANTGADIALGIPSTGGFAAGAFLVEAFIMESVLQTYKEIYNFFGPMTAYSQMFPTDMVGATSIAVSPRGDTGLVTYLDTNNVGFLSLETSPDLRGYGLGNFPNFFFNATLEKTVSGLNLDLGIEGGDINFFPPYSWLGMRDSAFTSDGSHAFIGMEGGTPTSEPHTNRFGFIDMGRIREGIGELNGQQNREALSAGFMQLIGSNGETGTAREFANPRNVATFHPIDSDGDLLSDHVEAFNRFNDLKFIPFGDRTQVVSTNSLSIADPVRSLTQDVFPVNYADKGYFLPHSGLGYRFNYNGHLRYSVNVGSAPAIRTLEKVGRIWHDMFIDGDVDQPYFVVLDMSHPGEGLVQNEDGEFLHFNPRNGFQANLQYMQVGSDEPLDFVLSNVPSDPLNNEVEGPADQLDIENMRTLCELLLDEPTVQRLIVDPKLVELVGGVLVDNPRVEIHGSLDIPNTRRDQDAFMKVLFQPESGIGIDTNAQVTFVDTETGDPVNLVALEPDPDLDDSEAVGIKLDILQEGAVTLQLTSSHELYFDADLTQRIDLTEPIRITDLLGTIWAQVSGPGAIEIDVQALDIDGVQVGDIFNYTGNAFVLDLDVGDGDVEPNPSDGDGDTVPDYADGFNFDRLSGAGDANNDSIVDLEDDFVSLMFKPIEIRVEGPIDFTKDPTIRIEYDASIPSNITKFVSDFHPGLEQFVLGSRIPRFALPTEGTLRIWKKSGSEMRSLTDFVAPGAHRLSDLGLTEEGSLTLYLEAVVPVILGEIKVSLDPDGFNGPASFIAEDLESVFTSGNRLDLKIDSNNDGSIGGDDDIIEDITNERDFPGKIILVNNSGSNGNGKADYLDFTGSAEHRFARLEFELPTGFDESSAFVSITYSASDPDAVIETEINGLDILPPGHLRLWKKDANESRTVSEDYVPPGSYRLSDLPGNRVLYVEGVQPSTDIGDQRIVFQFRVGAVDVTGEPIFLGDFNDPTIDLNVKPVGIYQDAVRVTVYEQRWENSFALDAPHRKVDLNGQPLLDPEPQNEPEVDLTKAGFYVDAFSRTPVFSTTDISVPTLGQTLSMEFRRTASIDAYLAGSDTTKPLNPVGVDTILGPGWRSCLGARVVHNQGIFNVYDENGQIHRYNQGGSPIPHSFEESTSHRSDLRIIRSEDNPNIVVAVVWTNNFWKRFTFSLYSPNQDDFGDRPLVGQVMRIASIADTNGNAIDFVYDSESDSYPSKIQERNFEQKEMAFTYMDLGAGKGLRLEELTDPNGNTYKYLYDGDGRLEEVQFPDPGDDVGGSASGDTSETYTYAERNHDFGDGTKTVFVALEEMTNPNGNRVTFEYELLDRDIAFYEDDVHALRLTKITTAAGSDIAASSTFEELEMGPYMTKTRIVDFRGTMCDYEFTTALIPSSVKDGLGFSFNGFIIPVLDMFTRTIFTANDGDQEWEYLFSNDTFSNLEQVTDSFGNERVFSYGRVNGFDHARYNRPFERIIDPITGSNPNGLNLKSQFEYNFSNRRLLKETKPRFFTEGGDDDTFVRNNEYDERRNVTQSSTMVTDPDGVERRHRSSFNYDDEGYISATMDPHGRVTRIERETQSDTWTDKITIYEEYSGVELEDINFSGLTPALITTKTYDLNGNVIQEEVEYDNPDSGGMIIDVTNNTYDAANNKIKVELPSVPDGDTGSIPTFARPEIEFEYDGLGKITKRIDARDTETVYEYDERENKKMETTAIDEGAEIINVYAYDAAGLVTLHVDPNGNETNYTYDELNRKITMEELNEYTAPDGLPADGGPRSMSWEYKDNSGGGAFSSDSWMPTLLTDFRGFDDEMTYDAAYRKTSHRQKGSGGDGEDTDDKFEEYELDANGNITKITRQNPAGSGDQVTDMEYDELDRKISEEIHVNTGPNIVKKFFYDHTNNLVAVVDGEGFLEQMEYNTLGLVSKKAMRVEMANPSFVPDGFNDFAMDMLSVMNEDVLTTYEYDGRGNLIKETLRRDNYGPMGGLIDIVKEYRYDGLNRVEKIIENSDETTNDADDERIIRFVYDLNDNQRFRFVRRENYLGGFIEIETEYEYDLLDRKVLTRLPPVENGENNNFVVRGVETIAYDSNSNVVERIDARGTVTTMHYDGLDRAIQKVLNSDGNGEVLAQDDIRTSYLYDANDNVVEQRLRRQENIEAKDALVELLTTTKYDAFDRAVEMTDPENNVFLIEYDSLDNRIAQTDPRGFRTDMTFDTANRMIRQEDPLVFIFATGTIVDPFSIRPVTEMTYDRRDLVKTETDGNNHTTEYIYDGIKRRIEVVNAEGNSMFYEYDQAGNIKSTTDFRGQVMSETFDGLNRSVTKTDDAGFTVTYEYDLSNNLMALIDAKSEREEYVFDQLDRRIEEKKRGNDSVTTFSYNLTDGLTQKTDENDLDTLYEYDAFNRVTKEIDHDGNEVIYEYDQAHNRVRERDEVLLEKLYVFDRINRLTKLVEERDKETEYEYDASSNRTLIRDDSDFETMFTYDALNRLATHTLPTGETYTYGYDATRNIVQVGNPEGDTISHIYDELDRLTEKSFPGHEYIFKYDANSNLTEERHDVNNLGGTGETYLTTYEYENRDLLEKVICDYPGILPREMSYTYDENRNFLTKNSFNSRVISYETNEKDLYSKISGDLGTGTLEAVCGYDDALRPTFKRYGNSVNTTFAYDNRNLILEKKATHLNTDDEVYANEYGYNPKRHRLFEKESYTVPSTDMLTVNADVHRYDSLLRITGTHYGVPAERNEVVSAFALPISPGVFTDFEATLGSYEEYSFDGPHNRVSGVNQRGRFLYNHPADPGTGAIVGYFPELLHRLFSLRSVVIDPDDPVQSKLYFLDANGDGVYSTGEEIYVDDEGAADGEFDRDAAEVFAFFSSGDLRIFDGGPPDADAKDEFEDLGLLGTQLGLYFHDFDGSGTYDLGEDLWAERNGSTDAVFNLGDDFFISVFSSHDEPVYGGDVPENIAEPLNGFSVSVCEAGATNTLYYHDANANQRHDDGEDIWFSTAGAVYDAGVDTIVGNSDDVSQIIYRGDDGLQVAHSDVGSQSMLYYYDANSNGQWNAGEGIWRETIPGNQSGTQGNVYYSDTNINRGWNETEDIWLNIPATLVTSEGGDLGGSKPDGVPVEVLPFLLPVPGGPAENAGDLVTFDYDKNGNQTRFGPTRTFTWTAINQTETVVDNEVETARYIYNGSGLRVAKIIPGVGRTYYFYDGREVCVEVDDGGVVTAEYLNGSMIDHPIAMVKNGTSTFYFHQNSLGNVQTLTDLNGDVVERYDYDIYGNARVLDADGNFTGDMSTAQSPYLYTGRRYDAESNYYYMRSRYFSPEIGRYTSHAPYDYRDSVNLYAYVNGNVINHISPSGDFLRAVFLRDPLPATNALGAQSEGDDMMAASAVSEAGKRRMSDEWRYAGGPSQWSRAGRAIESLKGQGLWQGAGNLVRDSQRNQTRPRFGASPTIASRTRTHFSPQFSAGARVSNYLGHSNYSPPDFGALAQKGVNGVLADSRSFADQIVSDASMIAGAMQFAPTMVDMAFDPRNAMNTLRASGELRVGYQSGGGFGLGDAAFAAGAGLALYDSYKATNRYVDEMKATMQSNLDTMSMQQENILEMYRNGDISSDEAARQIRQSYENFEMQQEGAYGAARANILLSAFRGFANAIDAALPISLANNIDNLKHD